MRDIAIAQTTNRIINQRLCGWIKPVFRAVATDIRVHCYLYRIRANTQGLDDARWRESANATARADQSIDLQMVHSVHVHGAIRFLKSGDHLAACFGPPGR